MFPKYKHPQVAPRSNGPCIFTKTLDRGVFASRLRDRNFFYKKAALLHKTRNGRMPRLEQIIQELEEQEAFILSDLNPGSWKLRRRTAHILPLLVHSIIGCPFFEARSSGDDLWRDLCSSVSPSTLVDHLRPRTFD